MPGRLTRLSSLDTVRTEGRPRPRLQPRGLPPALAPHGVFEVFDPVEAEVYGRDLLGRHSVVVADADRAAFRVSLHAVLIRDVTLGFLEYGTAVRLELHETSPNQLILLPASGTSAVTQGDESVGLSPVVAGLPRPGEPAVIEIPADTAHIVIRIGKVALEHHLSRLLGRRLDRAVEFDLAFDVAQPTANRWNLAVQMLHSELYEAQSLLHDGIGLGQIEEFLMSSLLYCQRSNHADLLRPSSPVSHRAVRAAQDFIEANLARAIGPAEVAEAAGVSVRTLQHLFQHELSQPVTRYIADRRLDRVRSELADVPPTSRQSVARIASRWGFQHLGRFSVAYKQRFGESPSQTLRS